MPVLWDTRRRCIVSNESWEIAQMLNSQFNGWARHPRLDLFPADLRPQIDQVGCAAGCTCAALCCALLHAGRGASAVPPHATARSTNGCTPP